MGYILCQSLHQDYKKVIVYAMESGKLLIMGTPDQNVVFQSIIALVGEETPIDKTNRILVAYQNLHKCNRPKTESPSSYVDRFRGTCRHGRHGERFAVAGDGHVAELEVGRKYIELASNSAGWRLRETYAS